MPIQSLNKQLDNNQYGAKASHLSKMLAANFPIPAGFAISKEIHAKYLNNTLNEAEFLEDLTNELRKIDSKKFMVRSSAIGEDSNDNSFAGQLESFISEGDVNSIYDNIKKCWNSYNKTNVISYQELTGRELKGMAVLVQTLIDPEYAGVIFTRSHLLHNHLLVEYVQGHGEQLVSGNVTPKQFHYNLENQETIGDWLPILNDGIIVAQKIEQFYKYPCDIEWAYKDGKFYVVQSRPITTPSKEKEIYWSNTNVNENYPDPISPLLYSIARQAYYNYFKNLSKLFSIAESDIRQLESAYSNVIGIHGAKMYYNMSSIHEILSASPFSESLIKSFDNFVGYEEGNKGKSKPASFSQKIGFIKDFFKHNKQLEVNVSAFENMVDQFTSNVQNAISKEELKHNFATFIEIRMHSWKKASLADFYAMTFHGLLGKFCSKYYETLGTGVQNKLIQAIPGIISSKPVLDMHAIIQRIRASKEIYTCFKNETAEGFLNLLKNDSQFTELNKLIESYLTNWGFRCSGELMLTELNYIERPEKFIALLQQYEKMPESNPKEIIEKKHEETIQCIREFRKKIFYTNWYNQFANCRDQYLLGFLIKKAQQGIAARERARLKQALLYFGFKQTIQAIETNFIKENLLDSEGDILYLTYPEITEHLSASSITGGISKAEIELRKEKFKETSAQKFPDDFYTFAGTYTSPDKIIVKSTQTNSEATLKGLCACGGIISGRVKVLQSVLEADKLEKGDILITRQTDPGWVVVFPLISGLIVERGGMLSHGAIVSREFGIPAIVGVENATSLLKDGDEIILNADKGEIILREK